MLILSAFFLPQWAGNHAPYFFAFLIIVYRKYYTKGISESFVFYYLWIVFMAGVFPNLWCKVNYLIHTLHIIIKCKNLYIEFVNVLLKADYLFISDIYSAGEKPLKGINTSSLVRDISKRGLKNVHYKWKEKNLSPTINYQFDVCTLYLPLKYTEYDKKFLESLQYFELKSL